MSTRIRHVRTFAAPIPLDRRCRVSIHKDPDWREYRVRAYRDGIAHTPADYFTPDVEDAMDTARAMLETEVARLVPPAPRLPVLPVARLSVAPVMTGRA